MVDALEAVLGCDFNKNLNVVSSYVTQSRSTGLTDFGKCFTSKSGFFTLYILPPGYAAEIIILSVSVCLGYNF